MPSACLPTLRGGHTPPLTSSSAQRLARAGVLALALSGLLFWLATTERPHAVAAARARGATAADDAPGTAIGALAALATPRVGRCGEWPAADALWSLGAVPVSDRSRVLGWRCHASTARHEMARPRHREPALSAERCAAWCGARESAGGCCEWIPDPTNTGGSCAHTDGVPVLAEWPCEGADRLARACPTPLAFTACGTEGHAAAGFASRAGRTPAVCGLDGGHEASDALSLGSCASACLEDDRCVRFSFHSQLSLALVSWGGGGGR
jgi:hypothetical protein